MRPILFVFALIASLLALPAAASEPVASADGFDHGWSTWDQVLRKHVNGKGQVDYAALKGDARLAEVVQAIAEVPAEVVGAWPRDKQVAFYINAYNALTFQTILEAGIPGSIRDIKPDPWEDSRWTVAGRTVSLNWIEHTRLRGQLDEPRVHFVLVCAAVGCPRLPNRAVLSSSLNSQLDAATKAFFTDPAKNRVDAAGGKVYLSKILEWYGDDFVGWSGTPAEPALDGRAAKEAAAVRLMGRYQSEEDRAFLAKNDFTVVWNDYDWALNKQ